jgi:phosphatidylglycerophosphate synthase
MAKATAGTPGIERRPLQSRSSAWARWLAARLTATRITPNQISVLSVAAAALGGALLLWSPGWPAFIVAAACVQLRLLCNLLDGMVAIEGGKSTAIGALFNEMPDRLSDALFLVPLGYAADYPSLGWLAALLAVLTAYVRVLGGALGQVQDFGGMLSKQRRMAVLTIALLVAAVEDGLWGSRMSLLLAAIIIALGSLATCVSRTIGIAERLEGPPNVPGEGS